MENAPLLAQYRRTVAEHYAAVRVADDSEMLWNAWRIKRDKLLHEHPLSALTDEQRSAFKGIPYWNYDSRWRIEVEIDTDVPDDIISGELPEGHFRYQRVGYAHFMEPDGALGRLTIFWILGYGGGIFIPFRDTTNSDKTYGAGRYLYDTIKGADLGITETHIVLDFNFAYHPSCAYNPAWACPLAPPENRLDFAVTAGEQLLP